MQTEKNIWLRMLSMILTLALLISCLSLMGCEPKAGPPPYRTLEVTYAGVKVWIDYIKAFAAANHK